MSGVRVALTGGGECRVEHGDSGSVLETSSPPEFGGAGGAFSATDLVAAGLGACVATSVQAVATREGIADSRIGVSVEKTLTEKPRRIGALTVTVKIDAVLTDVQRRKLLAVARSCPVHRSLAPEVEVAFSLQHPDAAGES